MNQKQVDTLGLVISIGFVIVIAILLLSVAGVIRW